MLTVLDMRAQEDDHNVSYIVRGKVTESLTGEPIQGASIYLPETKKGTTTNNSGEYRLWLKPGTYVLQITSIGYQADQIQVTIYRDTIVSHSLQQKTSSLEEVLVYGEADIINNLRIGQNRLDLIALKKMPPLLGEPDIIRSLLLMPGVTSVGEGATGFNVRGGGVDQNLILLDDAPVFNVSHLFGFLTAFNSSTVLNADLYKAGIPASYGGRVASVLDVKLRQGNSNKLSGSGSIGLMAATLMLEGPIIRDRTTFLISGRGSYSDWLLKTIPDDDIRNSDASFYDVTGKLTHQINPDHLLSFTGYRSHDSFSFEGDTTYAWSTQNFTVKLGSSLGDKLFLTTTLVSSEYKYKVLSRSLTNEFDWTASVNFLNAKADLSIVVNDKNKTETGIGVERYRINLGSIYPVNGSNVNPFQLDSENALLLYGYVGHQLDLSDKFSFRAGVRVTSYRLYGPGTVNRYEEGKPRSDATFIQSDQFEKGDDIKQYYGIEPRFSMRYILSSNSSVKASYDHTVQFLHLISNTSAVSPIDLWKLSDTYLKPQIGDQYSVGFFRSSKKGYQFSIEAFYKTMDNIVDYKDGAELLLNDKLDADLLQGTGRAYGSEWMLEKKRGKLTGWLSYTLSRTERKVEGNFPEETISKGEYYPANYDKLHNLSLTASYQKSTRISWGFNFVFATGRPVTYPSSSYSYGGVRVINFEYRNNERGPVYHRLDISLEIKSREKPERKWHSSWVVSLYNAYARKNPYSIFFHSDYGVKPQSYRLAVIGTIVPSVSYTIIF